MALSSAFNVSYQNGNGLSITFTFTFKIADATHLVVYVGGVLTTSYTVAGVGVDSGGSVTFTVAPPTGTANVVLQRVVPFTQLSQYPEGSKFPTVQITNDLDLRAMADQQLNEVIGRSLVIPVTDAGISTALPNAAARANMFLAFNSTGAPVMSVSASGSGGPVTPFMTTVLSSVDAAAAQGTLSVPSTAAVVLKTIMVAKGDVLTATAAGTPVRKAVGVNGAVLLSDATSSDGLSWKLPPAAINLLPNSSLGICTAMNLRRIGNPITITGWSTLGSGAVLLSSAQSVAGHCEGLVPGKLILIEGPGTPHVAHVGLSGSATTPNSITQRITAAAASFTGLAVGDNVQITGGTNTDSRGFYRIQATDASTYIEIPYATAPVEGPVTYNITYYDGANKVDSTLNGMPATGAPQNSFVVGYPLMVTEANVGSFAALLPGAIITPGVTGTARAWEVAPGIFASNNGASPDGWGKTTTLELYREYQVDTDGLTSVVQAGEDYGVNVVGRAGSGIETLTATIAPTDNREKLALYKGRVVTLGAWTKAGVASVARLRINDGATTSYSAYFTSGAFEWKEVTATISASATQLIVGWELAASPGAVHHLTQPMLAFGASIGQGNYTRTTGKHNFTAHPNFMRNYVNGTNTSPQNIRIAQESGGAFPNGLLKGIYIGVEAKNSVVAASSSIIISDKIPLVIPSLTMYAQVVSVTIVNSGYAVVGRLAETYPATWVTDMLGFTPGNATWSGINLDMFAAELA